MLGDISEQAVDAIVNAASPSLLGGGGVDGAIHRKAGPGLAAECRTLGGCRPGEAKITGGYQLAARHVIHTVGPVWRGMLVASLQAMLGRSPDGVLARCYRSCFALVEQHGLKTVAFPSISTGVYGFPLSRAARIAVRESRAFLAGNSTVERVTVVCYTQESYDAYLKELKR
jgi:O-acetyl-ADP-ribose deacetylase (regulator of RNase III)